MNIGRAAERRARGVLARRRRGAKGALALTTA
jgi:hypothetical protein